MQEEWKDIGGYEGFYQVSNLGRIRSVDRTIECGGKYSRTLKGQLIAQKKAGAGYPAVGLRRDGHQRTAYVHRLVLGAFCGESEQEQECNHRDGNKTNNHIENLEWVTRSENSYHAHNTGLQPGRTILSPEIAKMIRNIYALGQYTQTEIGLMFGVCGTNVGYIVRGVYWPDAGGPIRKRGQQGCLSVK